MTCTDVWNIVQHKPVVWSCTVDICMPICTPGGLRSFFSKFADTLCFSQNRIFDQTSQCLQMVRDVCQHRVSRKPQGKLVNGTNHPVGSSFAGVTDEYMRRCFYTVAFPGFHNTNVRESPENIKYLGPFFTLLETWWNWKLYTSLNTCWKSASNRPVDFIVGTVMIGEIESKQSKVLQTQTRFWKSSFVAVIFGLIMPHWMIAVSWLTLRPTNHKKNYSTCMRYITSAYYADTMDYYRTFEAIPTHHVPNRVRGKF